FHYLYVSFFVYCFFFFSSRRRHTRWPRDWSSDVCSSDLGHGRGADGDAGWPAVYRFAGRHPHAPDDGGRPQRAVCQYSAAKVTGEEEQLQLAHEGDQGRLLPRRQLHAQHEVEELHRILQRQEAPIVQVWRRVLDPAQGEGLDGALGVVPLIVDRARLVEALDPQIVHLVVEVRRGRMTRRTAPLAEEHLLAQALLLGRLGRIEGPERGQLRGRREIEH